MERLSRLKPYLMMLALIAGLTGLRLLLLPVMKFVGPLAVYFLATAIAALYGGFRLALFTCAICVMVSAYFFIPPLYSLKVDNLADQALIMIFIVDALVFGVTGEIFKRARERKNELMHSLEHAKRHMELNQHTVRALLESSSQGIFGIDVDGTIRIANAAAHRIFRYEPDELLGKPLDVLIDAPQRAAHAAVLGRLRQAEQAEFGISLPHFLRPAGG